MWLTVILFVHNKVHVPCTYYYSVPLHHLRHFRPRNLHLVTTGQVEVSISTSYTPNKITLIWFKHVEYLYLYATSATFDISLVNITLLTVDWIAQTAV